MIKRVLNLFTLITFCFSSLYSYSVFSQTLNLPPAGTLLLQSDKFSAVTLKGLKIDPQDPFKFNFIIDTGNDQTDPVFLKQESQKLVNYFLAVLTTPEDDLWVNLSPYEQNRVIPQGLETTQMGHDLLAQDYILKQLASSLTYPETEPGKKYWDALNGVGARSPRPLSGRGNPAPTDFNRVWITPKTAVVAETKKGAFIVDSTLQVNMEKENPAFKANILPMLENEVNAGKNFAELRQIYSAMVLATWYKVRLKEAILNKVYADQKKLTGIDLADKADKDKIYAQYLQAFKQGAYNYVKREAVGTRFIASAHKITKRQYFSGGVAATGLSDGFKARAITGNVVGSVAAFIGLGALAFGAQSCNEKANDQINRTGKYQDVTVQLADVGAPLYADVASHMSQRNAEAAARRILAGDKSVTGLMQEFNDFSVDTDARKELPRQIVDQATAREADMVEAFLFEVIKKGEGKHPPSSRYKNNGIFWWHAEEAKSALSVLYGKFPQMLFPGATPEQAEKYQKLVDERRKLLDEIKSGVDPMKQMLREIRRGRKGEKETLSLDEIKKIRERRTRIAEIERQLPPGWRDLSAIPLLNHGRERIYYNAGLQLQETERRRTEAKADFDRAVLSRQGYIREHGMKDQKAINDLDAEVRRCLQKIAQVERDAKLGYDIYEDGVMVNGEMYSSPGASVRTPKPASSKSKDGSDKTINPQNFVPQIGSILALKAKDEDVIAEAIRRAVVAFGEDHEGLKVF